MGAIRLTKNLMVNSAAATKSLYNIVFLAAWFGPENVTFRENLSGCGLGLHSMADYSCLDSTLRYASISSFRFKYSSKAWTSATDCLRNSS